MDVDDTWYRKGPDGELIPSARNGTGLRWQARWRDPSGHQRKKSFARKGDADKHLAAVMTAMNRGAYIDPAAGRILLRVYAVQWLGSHTADPSSRLAMQTSLNRILDGLGDYQLARLQPTVIRGWLGDLSKRLAASTIQTTFGMLSSILSAAVDDELIVRNPCRSRSVSPPAREQQKIVPWTAGQVAAVATAIDPPWGAAVLTAAALGLRLGELLGLAAEDVDWLRRTVHVRRQVKQLRRDGRLAQCFALPKRQKTRDIPMSALASEILAGHVAAHPPAAVTLPWGDVDGKPATARLLFTRGSQSPHRQVFYERIWKPALTGAGMTASGPQDKVSPHALRHYAASSWLAGGANIRDVAEYLGHDDPGFTLRVYGHMMPSAADRLRSAMDAALADCAADVPPQGAGVQKRQVN